MPTVDVLVARLAARIDPRTKVAQQVFNDATSSIAVSGTENASGATKIFCASAHGMRPGQECYIKDVGGTTVANNTLANPAWVVTVLSSTTFTIPVTYAGAWTSGGTVVPAMICSSRGNSYEPQQILDLYNQGRMSVFSALRAKYSDDSRTLQRECGALIQSASLTWTGFVPMVVAKPAGYVDFIYMNDMFGVIHLLPPDRLQATIEGRPNYQQTTTNRHVFEQGAYFVHPGNLVVSPAALRHIGISDFTIANVLAGNVSETFSEQHIPAILELAQLISMELGGHDLAAVAKTLLGGK